MKINNNKIAGNVPIRLINLAAEYSKRKDFKNNLIKTYAVILFKYDKELKRNKKRTNQQPDHKVYVHLASSYFEKAICKRYHRYLKILKENEFIAVCGKSLDNYESQTGLFDDSRQIESYKVGEFSKRYRLIEFPTKTDPHIEIKTIIKENVIYKKNKEFLESVGVIEPKLTTDNYGFRVYHDLSTKYKEYLPDKGTFVYYDIKCSIPNHIKKYLEKFMQENGIEKDPFIKLFVGDFYTNWGNASGLNTKSRSCIKKSFSALIYGRTNGLCPKYLSSVRKNFPLLLNLIDRNLGKKITRLETKFMFKNIISKLSVSRVMSIHDGFIIHLEDEQIVDQILSNLNIEGQGFELVKSRL